MRTRERPARTPCTRAGPRRARHRRAKTLCTISASPPCCPAACASPGPARRRTHRAGPARTRKRPARTLCTRRRTRAAPNRRARTLCTSPRRRRARPPARTAQPRRAAALDAPAAPPAPGPARHPPVTARPAMPPSMAIALTPPAALARFAAQACKGRGGEPCLPTSVRLARCRGPICPAGTSAPRAGDAGCHPAATPETVDFRAPTPGTRLAVPGPDTAPDPS